eukprot:TRINITY_DN28238_c0_g1_i1.p1 TRINITY_DN28238_c0_g1~~TRINITY_DN28238_c0_g1_i1.p1  ORF type:complete len:275 (+),score=59.49 TRINITY_DN28238_c0_g1_i1:45-827(+)
MAGTWRMHIQKLRDVGRASLRVGDLASKIAHPFDNDDRDPDLRNLVIEIQSGAKTLRSRMFHFSQASDDLVIDIVMFVPCPPPREGMTIRVIKTHSTSSDALLGEAVVTQPKGEMELQLMRKGKPQGVLHCAVTSGLPPMKAPSLAKQSLPAAQTQSPQSNPMQNSLQIQGLPPPSSDAEPPPIKRGSERPPPPPTATIPSEPASGAEKPPVTETALANGQAEASKVTEGSSNDIVGNLIDCVLGIMKGVVELCCKEKKN